MTIRNRLQAIVEANPHDASIVLPISRLQAWLDADQVDNSRPQVATEPAADFTVHALGEIFGKRPSTVRDWIRRGQLEAYLFQKREYRVTREALDQFQANQRKNRPRAKAPTLVPAKNALEKGGRRKRSNSATVDFESWRTVYREAS